MGRPDVQDVMTIAPPAEQAENSMAQDLIHQYEAAGELLTQAIRGLTREDMLAVPDPAANVGRWSIQQVVCHLADAEFAFADRIRRILAEDEPVLQAWDENKFVANL